MEPQILKEIQEIRKSLSIIIGSYDLPVDQQFSKDTLDKAAEQFRKMSIERCEWITEYDIHKIIRKAPYICGKFIIEHFHFTHYFVRGRTTYFNRKTLMALNLELKERNINLERYMDLLKDKENFEKLVESTKQKGKLKKRFQIPDGLRDIDTRSYPPPSEDIILNHIANLKEELEKLKMTEYIDIYDDNYAMFKFVYHFDRYLEAGLKRRCRKWCDDFNYANNALKESKKPY